MLCGYFNEPVAQTPIERKTFVLRHRIALWDMVTECEIQGSADASVKNAKLAELSVIISNTKLKKILLNGTLAYDLFLQNYANIDIPYEKMPSTSPANPRYDEERWKRALDSVFATEKYN